MKEIVMMEVSQPIGTFYIGKMTSQELSAISYVSHRKDNMGHQRLLREKRAKEIALYCSDPDATFPTPIILAVPNDHFRIKKSFDYGMILFEYDDSIKYAEILDGQHRMAGIELSKLYNIEIPVIVMFSLREEQKAYVFSTINGNQARVDPSLIYDLFELSETRSPYKTCHHIARTMNSDSKSPFYRRLKMLEKRDSNLETISQNTFVTNICEYLISKHPQSDEIQIKKGVRLADEKKLPLRKFFINNKDDIILRILLNYFTAAKNAFPNEWSSPEQYIITKSVGFEGLVYALSVLIPFGEQNGDLSEQYFNNVFVRFKDILRKNNIELTSQFFSSSSQNAKNLAAYIIQANSEL